MRPIAMALALGTVFWSPVEGGTGRADAVDRQKVVDALKKQWAAIKTLEVHGEEFVCDAPGSRSTREGLTKSEFDFFMAPNAKRALKVTYVFPDGRRDLNEDYREDGRRLYRIGAYSGHPEVIDQVRITPQLSSATRQRDLLNSLFVWCWTPRGRPPHVHAEAAEAIVPRKGKDGHEVLALSLPDDGIELELDPAHGYMPRRVDVPGFEEFVVTRFDSRDGVCFPVEGYVSHYQKVPNRAQFLGYLVQEVKLNSPLSPSTFTLPRLTHGALVQDATGGPSFLQGGVEARRSADAKYGRKETPKTPRPPPVAVTPTTSSSVFGSVLLLALGLTFFVIAWRLRARLS